MISRNLSTLLMGLSVFSQASAILDVVFVIDTTKSLEADVDLLKTNMGAIMSNVVNTVDSDARFGVAAFQDYGGISFGAPGDVPYERIVDLTADRAAVATAFAGASVRLGGTAGESALTAVFQLLTGAGQSFGQTGVIPENLNMNFRATATKIILLWTDARFNNPADDIAYPGPTFASVIAELTKSGISPPYRFVGLNKATIPDPTTDLKRLADATQSKSTRAFDCFAGKPIALGADIVCDGAGGALIPTAFVNVIAEAYLIDNPTVSPITIACFSENNFVHVQGKGNVPMAELEIGDFVQTCNKDKFSQVYSFFHKQTELKSTYMRITTTRGATVEVSGDHMMQTTQAVVRAADVRQGDRLPGSGVVESVQRVARRGVYAPITKAGNLKVSGVCASSYVAHWEYAPWMQNVATHVSMSIFRMGCDLVSCEKETYDEGTGYAWKYGIGIAFIAQMQALGGLAQWFVTLVGAPLILAIFLFEHTVFQYPVAFASAMGAYYFLSKHKSH